MKAAKSNRRRAGMKNLVIGVLSAAGLLVGVALAKIERAER
jgi:hypothetical protein